MRLGATGLETDAWVTADGVVVLDHDGTAGPDGEVPIAALRRDELPSHIPTLADLYAACGTDHELSIDVKDEAVFPLLVDVARAAGASERLWCCHHRWRIVAGWRGAAPEVRLVDSTYLGFMSGGPAERFARLVDAGIDAVNLHRSEWEPDIAELAASHGLVRFGWDAQTEHDLVTVVGLGLDGVYSDHVERMVAVARGL